MHHACHDKESTLNLGKHPIVSRSSSPEAPKKTKTLYYQIYGRTVKSLECRWDKINPACTLYGACLIAAEARNQSGSNEQDI
ncbi:hypothetical protein FRX31_021361, partial [Thalictrum thalictroides]